MNNTTKEIMDILQEECAEVIVAVSKISRFGIDNYKPGKPLTNRQHLTDELGDLQAMIDLCIEHGVVDIDALNVAKNAKHKKLKTWSTIYEKTT